MKTIQKSFDGMTDRYAWDFKKCTSKNGWAQVDTTQDASYFGTWTNPFTFETINYCEGDIYHTRCDTAEEYAADLRESKRWNDERGYKYGIDGMCNEKIIARFHELKLSDLLH